MKKKVLSLVLIGAMVASMAACGGKGNDKPDANKGGSAAQEGGAAASGDENTLTVWAWDPAFNIPALKAAEADYQKEHPDFKLNIIEKSSDDIQTALVSAGQSGDLSTLPDISLQQDNNYIKNLQAYPDIFTDVTDIGIKWDDFSADKLSKTTVDDKHYGVPVDNGTCIAAYRTDVLKDAGYTVKDLTGVSWDEFIKIGEDVYKKTGKTLLSTVAGENDLFLIMLQAEGATMYNEDGSANVANNEVVQKCVDKMVEMINKNVVALTNNWDEYVSTFTKDTVAGAINGNWIIPTIETVKDNSGKWEITTLPTLDGKEGYASNGGSSLFVSTASKKADLAKDFLTKTFGSSTVTYDQALKDGGVISTYLPAGESKVYQEGVEYFGGQPIYSTIVGYSEKVPVVLDSPYHYEGREKLCTAIVQIKDGADAKAALQDAEAQLNQAMGK